MTTRADLFELRIPEYRLHSAFRALRDSPFHGAARSLMNSLYQRMGDRNATFINGFQGEGFHSHLFELACYAYLEDARFHVERPDPSPDFLATTRAGNAIAVEATTANPTTGRMTDISLRALSELSQEEILEKVELEFPKRMQSILMRKLMRRYHERPHCEGLPLVLVVAPFFEAGSTTYVDRSLLNLFYGRNDDADGSDGLFHDPDGAQISGVLYTNAFTVSRFVRIATPWQTADFVAEREGVCYQPDEPESTYVFRFRMGAPETPRETWAEGVTLFLNPNATTPLGEGALPCSCLYACDDTGVYRTISGFHPLSSATVMNPRAEASTHMASQP